MEQIEDGFRAPGPATFQRSWTSWIALIVLIAFVGLPLFYWLRGLIGR